jgi:hypothetical protein
MIRKFPQYRTRLLKTLRTAAKNKVSQSKKLAALHYFPAWLMEQSPYRDYVQPDNVDATAEVIANYTNFDTDEIPF